MGVIATPCWNVIVPRSGPMNLGARPEISHVTSAISLHSPAILPHDSASAVVVRGHEPDGTVDRACHARRYRNHPGPRIAAIRNLRRIAFGDLRVRSRPDANPVTVFAVIPAPRIASHLKVVLDDEGISDREGSPAPDRGDLRDGDR